MDLETAIDNELERLYEYQYDQGAWSFEEFTAVLAPLQIALCNLVRTTECASQTVREGEQFNENGLVQPEVEQSPSPDNAEASGDAETNDDRQVNLIGTEWVQPKEVEKVEPPQMDGPMCQPITQEERQFHYVDKGR